MSHSDNPAVGMSHSRIPQSGRSLKTSRNYCVIFEGGKELDKDISYP